ncbi:MAG: class I SAM-dependent methyltransferase [Terriglobales bacterium]
MTIDPSSIHEQILYELELAGAAHDAAQAEHRRKRLNLERETAKLLQLFILSGRRRRVLEIGTSNGYSALWLAAALLRIPDAHQLITIERDAEKAEEARLNIARAGLGDWVDIRVGDATEVVRSLDGPFDAVFFDADRVSAPAQLAILLPKLDANVILLADNALSHPQEIAGYLEAVNKLPDFSSMIVPVGKGLHVAHRVGS